MPQSMTGTGIEFKAASILIGKCFLWLAIVFGWEPTFEFVVLQIETTGALSPYIKAVLNDIKVLSGAVVGVLVAVKLFIGLIKKKDKKQ